MKIFKKILIATGALFGLALSLSLMQRKTILLIGRIEYKGNKKNIEADEVELKKEHRIRKISGNNQGFILFKNNEEIITSKERNELVYVGTHLFQGTYKVVPVNAGKRQSAEIIIELVE